MMAESNPIAGKRDIVDTIVDGAKEENHVCCHRKDHHGYDDYHPDSNCYEEGSGCERGYRCSGMSR